jgi:hypothetical protein
MIWEENKQLKAENSELRGRLGLNSTNSSKPPNSDGLKKKLITPAIPREKHKKGGQEGHKGNTLKRVTNPDKIIKHLPTKCQCCGVKHRGEYPQNVAATTQYEPEVKALAVNLSIDYKMPIEQISNLVNDLYGCKLNSSTILETLDHAYNKAAPLLETPQLNTTKRKKGRPKKSPGRNLLDRLSRHKEEVLAFVFKDGVPFKNNHAERDLRGVKVKQEVSDCFRTMADAIVYTRLQGVILTFRKRGENVLENLRILFL